MELIIFAFAVWRITSLLVEEEGPWGLLDKFRHIVGIRYNESGYPIGKNVIAKALSCFWCASIWVSILLLPVYLLCIYMLLPFAISGMAILINKVIDG